MLPYMKTHGQVSHRLRVELYESGVTRDENTRSSYHVDLELSDRSQE